MKRLFTLTAAMSAVVTLLLAPAAWGLDTSKLKPTGYVNDFAHVLDAGSAQTLEAYCANLERATGAQMAIVLVDSLDDEPADDVGNRLFREWGIGKKGQDEGILLLLSIKDRKSRAEVGYGLEPIITDGDAGAILRSIRPILRQGNYGGALLAAAEQIGNQIAQAKGVALDATQPLRRVGPVQRDVGIPFPVILLGFVFLLWLLGRGGRGGGATGFLTGMILGNMMGRRGGFGGGWGGGGFGGYDGGGGGGGFGGFGGGDSGGGGASSDW
jgi:uncharacterized protein